MHSHCIRCRQHRVQQTLAGVSINDTPALTGQLRQMLPEDSWLEVKYEELVTLPEQNLRRTLEFLELPWHDDTLAYYTNKNVTVHNAPTYADVKEEPHRPVDKLSKKFHSIAPHLGTDYAATGIRVVTAAIPAGTEIRVTTKANIPRHCQVWVPAIGVNTESKI